MNHLSSRTRAQKGRFPSPINGLISRSFCLKAIDAYSGLCGHIDFEAEVDAGVADTATELKVEAV